MVIGLLACDNNRCDSWASSSGTLVNWSKCADGKSRQVECAKVPKKTPERYKCTCSVNGTLEKSFERDAPIFGDKQKSTQIANAACGWKIATN